MTAGTAYAGGYTTPTVEAPAMAPVAVAPANLDWTGFYAGAQLGYGNTEGDFSDDRGGYGGVHAGYLHDMGTYVLGGEVDYSAVDSDQVKSMAHIKGIAGIDRGQWLYYGTLGAGYIDSDINDASDTVLTVGAGVDYMLDDKWMVGGEVLYHDTDDFDNTGRDFDMTTVGVKASMRF
ncbi:outer membrane protein [Thioclava sp. SK-1]|uniref:outer membrane protein n=1 Tax=Thioclava sp. SK-1 TaxID=1889770 RepID=UPI00159F1694|nr:outer membrane beta-barrel protein [Thioclava sp. SK-1]